MWRAIRLVLDTGIHTMGWSRQEAIDYFMANSAKTENDITVEVDRYIVWPGQALSYKIGELKIRELRNYAEQQLRERFNIREIPRPSARKRRPSPPSPGKPHQILRFTTKSRRAQSFKTTPLRPLR